jgi:hypothetical protein
MISADTASRYTRPHPSALPSAEDLRATIDQLVTVSTPPIHIAFPPKRWGTREAASLTSNGTVVRPACPDRSPVEHFVPDDLLTPDDAR